MKKTNLQPRNEGKKLARCENHSHLKKRRPPKLSTFNVFHCNTFKVAMKKRVWWLTSIQEVNEWHEHQQSTWMVYKIKETRSSIPFIKGHETKTKIEQPVIYKIILVTNGQSRRSSIKPSLNPMTTPGYRSNAWKIQTWLRKSKCYDPIKVSWLVARSSNVWKIQTWLSKWKCYDPIKVSCLVARS